MKPKPHTHFTTGQPCNCTWAKHVAPEPYDKLATQDKPEMVWSHGDVWVEKPDPPHGNS